VLDTVRDGSLRDFEALEAATIDHVARETGVDPATVRWSRRTTRSTPPTSSPPRSAIW